MGRMEQDERYRFPAHPAHPVGCCLLLKQPETITAD
jgi:hypothetical protein